MLGATFVAMLENYVLMVGPR